MSAERAQWNAWARAAADGDRAAIEPLFRALWPRAVAYATRLAGDAALAEDCAQLALARVFERLDQFDRSRDVLTWALSHVTWECRTARKTRSRRGEVPADDAPPAALDGVVLVEERDLIRHAVAAIAELSPRDADTIAAALAGAHDDVSAATFRKRWERALARLRTSWRARHDTH